MYIQSPAHHSGEVVFAQTASFAPFTGAVPGVTVATTSTTTGADLLVSGAGPGGSEVRKYGLGRAAPDEKTLAPTLLTTLPKVPGATGAAALAGH